MLLASAAIAGALLSAGCTRPIVDADGGGALDAPAQDTPALDAPAPDAPGLDVPPGIDGGRLDAPPMPDAPIDAGPPSDAPRSDAPSDVPGASICDAAYGALPGYVLCAESVDSCEIVVDGGVVKDCREACSTAPGGECNDAFRTDGVTCMRGPHTACGAGGATLICICRL